MCKISLNIPNLWGGGTVEAQLSPAGSENWTNIHSSKLTIKGNIVDIDLGTEGFYDLRVRKLGEDWSEGQRIEIKTCEKVPYALWGDKKVYDGDTITFTKCDEVLNYIELQKKSIPNFENYLETQVTFDNSIDVITNLEYGVNETDDVVSFSLFNANKNKDLPTDLVFVIIYKDYSQKSVRIHLEASEDCFYKEDCSKVPSKSDYYNKNIDVNGYLVTPNGDGKNEEFTLPIGLLCYSPEGFRVKVMDRNGTIYYNEFMKRNYLSSEDGKWYDVIWNPKDSVNGLPPDAEYWVTIQNADGSNMFNKPVMVQIVTS